MHLRDFLESRERELMVEIAALHKQLTPLEGELAEIRRAKAAVGSTRSAARESAAKLGKDATDSPEPRSSPDRLNVMDGSAASAYAGLPIKQLAIKALAEHFPNGATTRQLRDFICNAWERDLPRTSLVPQLSRLYHDEVIGRHNSGWILLRERPEANGHDIPQPPEEGLLPEGQPAPSL
jgi:hypothetical protein